MKPNTLIVDDDRSITLSLINILTMQGYNAISANSTDKALELIKNNKFIKIAFFDINMPEMNGVELLKQVRKFNDNLRVIMMTAASSDSNLIQEAFQAGAEDCLKKPFEIPELLKLLAKLIKK
jgi:DNA-binding NtrC family response regulator